MKTIRSKEIIDLAERFEAARQQEKELQAALKTMRDSLMAALGDEASAKAGEYLLLVSDRVRTDLDKKALTEALGDEIKQYEKKISYQILEIKKA